MKTIITSVICASILVSCGGGDSGSQQESTQQIKYKKIYDNEIIGLDYTSPACKQDRCQTTDRGFMYLNNNDNIAFMIGGINLGSVEVKNDNIFLSDLYNDTKTIDADTIKSARLLQAVSTMSSDKMIIDKSKISSQMQTNQDIKSVNIKALNLSLPTQDKVKQHLENTKKQYFNPNKPNVPTNPDINDNTQNDQVIPPKKSPFTCGDNPSFKSVAFNHILFKDQIDTFISTYNSKSSQVPNQYLKDYEFIIDGMNVNINNEFIRPTSNSIKKQTDKAEITINLSCKTKTDETKNIQGKISIDIVDQNDENQMIKTITKQIEERFNAFSAPKNEYASAYKLDILNNPSTKSFEKLASFIDIDFLKNEIQKLPNIKDQSDPLDKFVTNINIKRNDNEGKIYLSYTLYQQQSKNQTLSGFEAVDQKKLLNIFTPVLLVKKEKQDKVKDNENVKIFESNDNNFNQYATTLGLNKEELKLELDSKDLNIFCKKQTFDVFMCGGIVPKSLSIKTNKTNGDKLVVTLYTSTSSTSDDTKEFEIDLKREVF